MVAAVSPPSLPGLTRQSIFFAKCSCEADGPPNSGSPEFGFLSCASRINPTCVVKPAGDARELQFLNDAVATDRNLKLTALGRDAAAQERVDLSAGQRPVLVEISDDRLHERFRERDGAFLVAQVVVEN